MFELTVNYHNGQIDTFSGEFDEMYALFQEYKEGAELVEDYVSDDESEEYMAACWLNDTVLMMIK
jgi:hypothetical protein